CSRLQKIPAIGSHRRCHPWTTQPRFGPLAKPHRGSFASNTRRMSRCPDWPSCSGDWWRVGEGFEIEHLRSDVGIANSSLAFGILHLSFDSGSSSLKSAKRILKPSFAGELP